MRLLVLGATGRTGSQLLGFAGERNDTVRVLVRDPAKLAPAVSRLEVVVGNVTEASDLARALPHVDAVLVALGADRSTPDLASRVARTLVPALQDHDVKRVVVLSSFGVSATLRMASRPQRLAYRTVLRRLFADKAEADAIWMSSELHWTLVYAMRLTDGPHTAEYAAVETCKTKGFPGISRADVARFMLDQVDGDAWKRRIAILGPRRAFASPS
jgi:putative NADH-flavin reductase